MVDVASLYLSRRSLLISAAGCGVSFHPFTSAKAATDEAVTLIEQLTGKIPVESHRIRLDMPIMFPNGYTVPLAVDVECPMTETDHVKYIRILAPRNPLIDVATFHFVAGRSKARVSTRIRLAEPQNVLALAEMNDGKMIMARTWVTVATNGCK